MGRKTPLPPLVRGTSQQGLDVGHGVLTEQVGRAIRAWRGVGVRHNALRATALVVGLSILLIILGWVCGGITGIKLGIVIVALVNGLIYLFGDTMALRAMHARPVSEIEQPELYRIVRELATEARQPMPRLYLSPTKAPNAFTTGWNRRRAALCCTTGLLSLLNERELRGVIAHELTHLRKGDTIVGTVAAMLALSITSLTALSLLLPLADSDDEDGHDLLQGLLFLVVGPIAAAVIRAAVGRAQEYAADEAAARLTGDPIGLANALHRIEVVSRVHPLPVHRGLLTSAHLMVAHPFAGQREGRIFAVHPPTRERIRRLHALAQRWNCE
ncbi:HtpX-2 peptidase. Metallo peptidase. MEROPS family M48B [Thermobifida fusca YX]|uniref:HtpX-2 peptidase. Metallo peptidase. MEROPS family M48B n=1 Tax=Thermobifida fusca (strain YX) TaxID=269800 RepID=Q47LG6_THEFY|nr:HtpX-2 peptidase. Metallo peptidase. MEROPS family M48B [Thermobifida fusca YX]